MDQYSNSLECPRDVEGGALLFTPDTPILTPVTPNASSPISEFWLNEAAFGNSHEPFNRYDLTVELADTLPTAKAEPVLAGYIEFTSRPGSANSAQADQAPSDTPLAAAEIDDMDEDFEDLRITDLTLDQIDAKIITLSDQLLTARLQCRHIKEDLVDASSEWVVFMDGLRVKIWRLDEIIDALEGKCNNSLHDTDIYGITCEIVVRRQMKGKLIKQLSWAEKEWMALDEEELMGAEFTVRTTEEKIGHLRRVREVVMLTEYME